MENSGILVVDDAEFMRVLLGNLIKDIGFSNVHFADNGFQAIEKASYLLPKIITLDISMPQMDGLQALDSLLQVSPHSKIIMVTALTSQVLVKEAIRKGAVDFIGKPFDKSVVEQTIKKHL